MKEILKQALDKGISYTEYIDWVSTLVAQGKTSGENQTESLINYTKLNAARMRRLEKRYQPSEQVKRAIDTLTEKETWLVITEAWCGDAAQNIPIIGKIAELHSQVELRLVMRDEHLELMDLFLTNGTRGIPKLIRLNNQLEVVNTWGPRPMVAQQLVIDYKANPEMPYAQFAESLQQWYNQNKGEEVEKELIAMIKEKSMVV
jgi:hypothetical protein